MYRKVIAQLLYKHGVPQYDPKSMTLRDWRLFIDSSKRSLNCVMLHNGNNFAFLPFVHSTTLKRNYEAVK